MSNLPEPKNKKQMMSLHFLVEADFIIDLARQRFWFEDAEQHAIDMLECISNITPEMIEKVLHGNARFTGYGICDRKECHQCKGLDPISYVEKEEPEFKKELKKRIEYLKSNFFKAGETHISKNKVHEYLLQEMLCDQLSKYGDVSRGEEDITLDLMYDGFFTMVGLQPIKKTALPTVECRSYKFGIALQNLLNNFRNDESYMAKLREQFGIQLKRMQYQYVGFDSRVQTMLDIMYPHDVQDSLIDGFMKASRVDSDDDIEKYPCEMKYDGETTKVGKWIVEKRFMEDYANEVRFSRSMMMMASLGRVTIDASQHPIEKREAKHRRLYKSIGLIYHSDARDMDLDAKEGTFDFTTEIDEWIIKRYPELDIVKMSDKMDKTVEFIKDFKEKSKTKSKDKSRKKTKK